MGNEFHGEVIVKVIKKELQTTQVQKCRSTGGWWCGGADEVCSVGSNVLSRCSCLLTCLAEVIVQVQLLSQMVQRSEGEEVVQRC